MKRLAALDYLRFFAAVYVLFFHYFFNGIQNGKISSIDNVGFLADFSKYGYLGVDLFFMISGYVIFFSANNRTAEQFAVSRAVRLYPAYVVAVLFTSFFAFFWGGELMSVTLPQVLANLTMIQPLHGYPYVDGVYWTLMYEITFYAAVFLILFLGQARYLNAIFKFWPFLLLAGWAMGYDNLPFLGGHYAFFAAGSLFALMSRRRDYVALAGLALCFFLSIDFCLGLLPDKISTTGYDFSSWVVGALVAAFYSAFFLINIPRYADMELPASRLLGALTYPLYLVHAHFGYMFISRFATPDNIFLVYVACIAIVLGTAYAIHTLVEERLAWLWKRIFTNILAKPLTALRDVVLAWLRPQSAMPD